MEFFPLEQRFKLTRYFLQKAGSWRRAMSAGDIDAATEDPRTYGVLNDGTEERTIPTVPGRWRDYYENVADVLLNRTEPAVKLSEFRRQIAVLDAARRSAQSGEVVRPVTPV